jgi:hypothetical protein
MQARIKYVTQKTVTDEKLFSLSLTLSFLLI